VFENSVLRRVFGTDWKEVTRWRKFDYEELHNLYSLPNIIMVIKTEGDLCDIKHALGR
jgi:hypothetical protein